MTDLLAHVPAAIRTSLERLDVPQVIDENLINEVLARVTTVPWIGDLDAYTKAIVAIVDDIILPAMREAVAASQASLTKLEDYEAFRQMQTDDWIH